MSPHLSVGMISNCLNFEGNEFLSIHRLYRYVNVLTIAGPANFSIRTSTLSRSRVQDCLNAEKLFEISNVVTGRNIEDNCEFFAVNRIFQVT